MTEIKYTLENFGRQLQGITTSRPSGSGVGASHPLGALLVALLLGVPLLLARQLFLLGLLQLGKTGHKNTFNSIQGDLFKAGVPAWVNPDEVLHSLAQGTAHLPPKTKKLSIVQSACSS